MQACVGRNRRRPSVHPRRSFLDQAQYSFGCSGRRVSSCCCWSLIYYYSFSSCRFLKDAYSGEAFSHLSLSWLFNLLYFSCFHFVIRCHVYTASVHFSFRYVEDPTDYYFAVPRKLGILRKTKRTPSISTSDLLERVIQRGPDANSRAAPAKAVKAWWGQSEWLFSRDLAGENCLIDISEQPNP